MGAAAERVEREPEASEAACGLLNALDHSGASDRRFWLFWRYRAFSALALACSLSCLAALLPAGAFGGQPIGLKRASADHVLVHPPELIRTGVHMNEARLEAIHAALLRVVRDLEYLPIFEELPGEGAIPPPVSEEEYAAIARFYGAEYLIVPYIEPEPGGYLLHLEVYWSEGDRLERISTDVRDSREDIRLKEILYSMVRPRGIDDSRETLEGYDSVARTLEALESAEARRELSGEASEDEGEGGDLSGEPAERRVVLPPRFVQSSIGLRSLVLHDSKSPNSITGAVTLRIGRAMRRVPRLEMNAALEVGFGSAGSVALFGGGTYYFISPPAPRFRLGAGFAIGLYGGTSEGISGAAFTSRASLAADIALKGPFRLQIGLPEIQYFSLSGASLNVGAYLGASARF